LVIELTGANSRIIFAPLPADDPKQRQPDISKAKASLGWERNTQSQERLKLTIAYFDQPLSGGYSPTMPARGANQITLVGRPSRVAALVLA
jgi:hypothetical protein